MAQDGFHYLSKLSSRPSESDPDGRLTLPSTSYIDTQSARAGASHHNSLVTGHLHQAPQGLDSGLWPQEILHNCQRRGIIRSDTNTSDGKTK